MSSTPDIEESSLLRSLDRVDEYLARLQQLPTKLEFEETVEQDLWEAVTGQSDSPSEVRYIELPELAHSLIGTHEGENGPVDPWWLRDFDWKASFGGEEVKLRGNGLETFAENFDRDRTVVHRPALEADHISNALDALNNIQSKLEDRIGPIPDVRFPDLPDSLFVVKEGLVEPTTAFGVWIDEFLALAPGFDPEATALYLAHTGTSREAIESALDEKLAERLGELLAFEYSRNEPDIVEKFDDVLSLSRIFDRRIPVDDKYTELSGLQYQLYRGFLETVEPADGYARNLFENAMERTPPELETGEATPFTEVACGTPLIRYSDNRPKLMSVDMYAPPSNSGYKAPEYQNLETLFEEYGWFDDD